MSLRETLRTQLQTAGPAAVDMLSGRREPDAVVLVAALEAASLLDEVTAGQARAPRAAVLDAAHGSDVLPWLTEALDLSPAPLPEDDLAREATVHRWVTLAALQPLVPDGAARRIEALLDDLRGHMVADPNAFVDLAPVAEWMADQLDLDADHPAVALLEDLAETALDEPVPHAAVAAGYASARTRLRAPAPLAGWANRLATQFGTWLDELVAQPVRAMAADTVPGPRGRKLLWSGPDQAELCLLVVDGRLLLELFDAPDATVTLDGAPLDEVASDLPDSRCWALPASPPDGPLVVDLVVAGQIHRVELAK